MNGQKARRIRKKIRKELRKADLTPAGVQARGRAGAMIALGESINDKPRFMPGFLWEWFLDLVLDRERIEEVLTQVTNPVFVGPVVEGLLPQVEEVA